MKQVFKKSNTCSYSAKKMLKRSSLILSLILSCISISYSQSWSYEVRFDETTGGFPFPSADQILQMDAGTSATFQYDFLTNTGAGPSGSFIYAAGPDGVVDMEVVAMVIDGTTNGWTQIDADYDDTSAGSFRSDYNITSGNCSAPNDFAYVKFEFTFVNGLESSVSADYFSTRHTSTNGSSEGYEWTQIFINGIPAGVEANIGNYTNVDYSDVSGSSNFDAAGNWLNPPASNATGDPIGGTEFPNNMTISEFLGGMPGSGFNGAGWWSADGFNSDIFDAPEHSGGMNPLAGNDPDGVSAGDIGGSSTAATNLSGISGDFGLNDSDLITSVTYIFGLTDVAFDTDGDGCTQTNTLPAAGVTEFNLGFNEPCTYSFDITTSESCGVFTLDVNNITGSGAAAPVTTEAYDIIVNGTTVASGVTGMAQTGLTDASFIADGTTNFDVTIQLSSDANCASEALSFTAPSGSLPQIITFPANPAASGSGGGGGGIPLSSPN